MMPERSQDAYVRSANDLDARRKDARDPVWRACYRAGRLAGLLRQHPPLRLVRWRQA